jgi:hypothetical protein
MFSVRSVPGDRFVVVEDQEGAPGHSVVSLVDRAGKRTTLSPDWRFWWDVSWSPAGREVLFAAGRGDDYALHAVSLAGRERLVARIPGEFGVYDVDPRGRILLERRVRRSSVVVMPPASRASATCRGSTRRCWRIFRPMVGRCSWSSTGVHWRGRRPSICGRRTAFWLSGSARVNCWLCRRIAVSSLFCRSRQTLQTTSCSSPPPQTSDANFGKFLAVLGNAWFPDGRRLAVVAGQAPIRRVSPALRVGHRGRCAAPASRQRASWTGPSSRPGPLRGGPRREGGDRGLPGRRWFVPRSTGGCVGRRAAPLER